jgi:ADP-ribosyl-[dinitrogen reductase] hydrolase
MMNRNLLLDRARACLLAGAAGDALGAPVEFMNLAAIRSRFGIGGIRDYAAAYGGPGKITDDTQMTLFTAEGCLRALHHARTTGLDRAEEIIRAAYLRWLATQNAAAPTASDRSSFLMRQKALFSRRAPGNTCLSALGRRGGERNNSKGCGGIMRVAPCGILHAGDAAAAFALGLQCARLTHGHPTGYLSAGAFAAVIADVSAGKALPDAVTAARSILIGHPDHEETLRAIDLALQMAEEGAAAEQAIPQLGEGWIAEEALAIALYCALVAGSLEEGIVAAVNITGDSDSTGSMAGNLLGAMHGMAALPARWLATLELKEVIASIARDLVMLPEFGTTAADPAWLQRYPAL